MGRNHPVPGVLLLSDARNDAVLERAITRLPQGAGFVFRHYHLPPGERTRRFVRLARLCRARGIVVLASRPARGWRIAGTYGAPADLGPRGIRLATAHSLREIGQAMRGRADAVLLSPVFATRTHPGAATLGPVRFGLLARAAPLPVLALGGMTRARARALRVAGWAAIDGLA